MAPLKTQKLETKGMREFSFECKYEYYDTMFVHSIVLLYWVVYYILDFTLIMTINDNYIIRGWDIQLLN